MSQIRSTQSQPDHLAGSDLLRNFNQGLLHQPRHHLSPLPLQVDVDPYLHYQALQLRHFYSNNYQARSEKTDSEELNVDMQRRSENHSTASADTLREREGSLSPEIC